MAALFAVGASAAPPGRAPPGASFRETLEAIVEMEPFDAGVAVRDMLLGNYAPDEEPPPSEDDESPPLPQTEQIEQPQTEQTEQPEQPEQAEIASAEPEPPPPGETITASPGVSAEEAKASPGTAGIGIVRTNAETGSALADTKASDLGDTLQQQYRIGRDAFFEAFVFLSFKYSPEEGYFYTVQEPFQAAFGFNELYDRFAFVANCYVDTIRCKFRYNSRDWMVQLWKGGYGVFLCTGGEVGIYNKPLDRGVEHYDSAKQGDWIGMEMTIYREGVRLFTRSLEDCWWLTGFAWGTLPGFFQAPRVQCVMDSTLTFPNAEMASLFAGQLTKKGFAKRNTVSTDTPDSFVLMGAKVHIVWQKITESAY